MKFFSRKRRHTWIDALGSTFLLYSEAERIRNGIQKRYPERRFRVYGHALSGFEVQVRCEVQ